MLKLLSQLKYLYILYDRNKGTCRTANESHDVHGGDTWGQHPRVAVGDWGLPLRFVGGSRREAPSLSCALPWSQIGRMASCFRLCPEPLSGSPWGFPDWPV